jgi:cation:H+ antiporter
MISAVLLILGLGLLLGGADILVRGVSALARAAGVPPIIVGLTLVAFGTSLPEVVINTMSAAKGETGLAFGNIVGSCAINIGFVLALTAIIRPLDVEPSIITREMPIMLLAVGALLVLSEDRFLNQSSENALVRGDGIMLLLVFCVFLYSVVGAAMAPRAQRALAHDPFVEEVTENVERGQGPGAGGKTQPTWLSVLLTIAGLVGVGVGGRLALQGAISIAEALSIPEVIIGLTLVSFGTTLPELATSVMAARRGQADVAIGNIVGSNIFNMLFIGGIVSTIRPITMPVGGQADLLFMAGLCFILLPIARRGPRKITRAEGCTLLAGYLVYVSWRIWSVTPAAT